MKQIGILSFTLLLLFSCGKEKQKAFLVSEITNLKEKEIYLSYGTGNNGRIDTLKAHNGAFVVNAAPEEAETMTLFFPHSNRMITFYGNADSRLRISGDFSLPESISIVGDSVNNRLSAYRQSIRKELQSLDKANAKADKCWQTDSLKKYEETLYSPRQMADRASLRATTTAFVSKNSSTPEALLAVRDYLRLTGDVGAVKEWWPKIRGKSVKDFSTFMELKRVYKQVMLLSKGHTLIAFQAYNRENKPEYFYPESGKKMLVLFWSSADKYSSYLNRKLSGAKVQLEKDSLSYVALSLDDSYEQWKAAAKGLNGKQLQARGGFQNADLRKFGVGQTPTLLLTGRDGKITKVCMPGENPLK